MGNNNIKTFFQNERNLESFTQNISPFTVDLLQHMQYLTKHRNTLLPSKKMKSQTLNSNNLINFVMSDKNLNNLVKISELKEKLLVGMIPRDKTYDIEVNSFVNHINKPFNAPCVKRFSDLQNKIFLLLYHVFYLKEIEK